MTANNEIREEQTYFVTYQGDFVNVVSAYDPDEAIRAVREIHGGSLDDYSVSTGEFS